MGCCTRIGILELWLPGISQRWLAVHRICQSLLFDTDQCCYYTSDIVARWPKCQQIYMVRMWIDTFGITTAFLWRRKFIIYISGKQQRNSGTFRRCTYIHQVQFRRLDHFRRSSLLVHVFIPHVESWISLSRSIATSNEDDAIGYII